jgi:hypothetical protein
MKILCVQATKKLVVFVLGVASHQVADVSWHGLGIEQGFLDAMAAVSTLLSLTAMTEKTL